MNILHIDCSPRSPSHSRQLSQAIVERLLVLHPGARVSRRDLGLKQVPHAEASYATALASPGAAATSDALELSEELICELEAAGVVVIGTPMHNFTVPSVLKAWIDQVVRIGRTFIPSPEGKKGTLRDRPVFVGIASGGVFTGERANQPDFLMPYLTAALGCIGLNSLHFLPLQATTFLDDEGAAAKRHDLLGLVDAAAMRNAA